MSLSANSAPGSGVIHDIGYRRYDGPRLGSSAVFTAMFSHTLRGTYGIGRGVAAKIFPWFLVFSTVLPAFIIVAVASATDLDELPVEYSRYTLIVQMVPTLFVAAQAPQAVSRDLRFHTLPLYFSRPLDYRAYVRAKFAGLGCGVLGMLVLPLVVLYVGALLIELPVGEATGDFAAAVLGVAVLALMLTGVSLLLAAVTPRRGLGVAAIAAVLSGAYVVANMIQGIVDETAADPDVAGWWGLLSPITIYDGIQVFLFDAETSTVAGPPSDAAGMVFIAVAAILIAVCYALLLVRYRKVSKR